MHFQTKTSYIDVFPNQNFSDYDVFPEQKYKNDAFQSTICLIQYKACTLVMKPNHNCNMPLDFGQWL